MPFDLEGALRIDYSALDGLETEIQSRTEGTEAAVKVDTSSADAALSDLEGQLKDVQTLSTQLGRVVSKEHLAAAESTAQWDAAMRRLTVTERDAIALWQQLHEAAAQPLGQQAAANLRIVEARMGDVLATAKTKLDTFIARTTPAEEGLAVAADVGLTPGELVGMGSRQIPMTKYGVRSQIMTEIMGEMQTMFAGGDRSGMLSRLTSGRTGLITGGALAVGGGALSASLISGSLQAAQAEKLMAKSTEMVFGTAAGEYDDQAHALADSTGYMVTELQQAQIAFNKMALTLGMENAPQKPLTQLVTDLASNTGLPQYANNIQAVTNAVASGIGGAADALLDFGISLDDAYVMSLAVNRGFKAMGEAITPAQMAQARYNALMEQTAGIYGTAGETADDVGASMRRFHQSLQGAKAAVGDALMPVAKVVADFVANIPKPVMTVGIIGGMVAGVGAMAAGAVIGVAALKRAVQDLGIAAGASAASTKAAATSTGTATVATGKLTGRLGGLGRAVGVTAAAVSVAIPVVTAVWTATEAALQGPKQQASLHELYARVATRRNLAQKTGEWTPMGTTERAELVQLYGEPAKGELSAGQVNAAIDAAEARAIQTLSAGGHMSDETAQFFAQQLQHAIDERALGRAMMENPSVAASQTLTVLLQDATNGGLANPDVNSYTESIY